MERSDTPPDGESRRDATRMDPDHAETAGAAVDRFFEREEEIYALQLGLAMAEHVLLLGPPGTAKSSLIEAMTRPLGLRRFSLLLGEYTRPEEVFGPIRISALQQDRYERALDGYFCTAAVVFLDEVFKGSTAILNTLLRAMNERVFDNGGAQIRLPLQTLVGASNEWPKGNPALEAAYDRFLIRRRVEPISNDVAFLLGEGTRWCEAPRDTPVGADLTRVHVPRETLILIAEATRQVKEKGIVVSDRRLMACRRVVQAAALLEGRLEAAPMDVLALRFVLWTDPNDADHVEKTLYHLATPEVAECRQLVADLERAASEVQGESLDAKAVQLMADFRTAHERIDRHVRRAARPDKIQPYLDRLLELKREVFERHLNLG